MSLGKGLESLIPPRDDSQKSDVSSDLKSNIPSPQHSPTNPPVTNGPVLLHIASLGDEPELPAPPEQEKLDTEEHAHPAFAEATAGRPQPREYLSVERKTVRQPVEKRPQEGAAVFYLEVSKIHPNPDQPRRHFDEEAIRDLASSIREFGIIQPITVSKKMYDTPQGTEVEYELIAGERRLLAAKSLGMETVPAIIRNVEKDRERLEIAVIENLQRENLNPIEMARAFARLQDEFRMTQREIASRLGKSRETVANTMRLLDLPSKIQESLAKNEISESHGRLLLAVEDESAREKIFEDLLKTRMTTRELKHRVELSSGPKEKHDRHDLPPELQMIREKLSSELGAPVDIQGGTENGGKITISFYSEEELRNILGRIGNSE